MKPEKKLDSRLASAIPYIQKGARVADVGTDHAYLPIELIRKGLAKEAVACDINRGPIERAQAHIREAGLSERIQTIQTDGLHGVESFAPDHVVIFGMGGELIAKILSEAPWIQNPSVRLILQPMTKSEELRRYLCENGFRILGETLTEEGQIYQTLCAVYDGSHEVYTEAELLVGKAALVCEEPLFPAFLSHRIAVLNTVRAGKQKAENPDTAYEDRLIFELCAWQSRLSKQ